MTYKFFIFLPFFLVTNEVCGFQDDDAIWTDGAASLDSKNEKLREKRCEKSTTFINGKQHACKGDIIFEEHFDYEGHASSEDSFDLLNSSKWKREIKIPQHPDYEFCVYHKLPKNLKIENGALSIIPTILEDEFGEDIVYFGRLQLADCEGTVQECSKNATSYLILPPVISARVTTRGALSFRYGKIEIRAKCPRGDWLYPEMRLTSSSSDSRITLGLVRGNDNFRKTDQQNTDFSSKQLEFGFDSSKVRKSINSGLWVDEFHLYTTEWTNEEFIFYVDGEKVGEIPIAGKNSTAEFYLTLGLGVGGINVFPDGTNSGHYEKPWRNVGAKAMLRFWKAKEQWLPTWRLGSPQTAKFQIDYVKIFSV